MLRRYFFALDPARRRWRRADPFPWAKSPRRSQPLAAGGPVPVSQIAATIAADGGNSSRSSHPPAFSTVSHGKNAASAGARPSPSGFYPRLPPAERTLRRAVPLALSPPSASFDSLSRKERRGGGRRLRPCAKDGTAAPGEKSTFPFTTLPAKMKKNAPPGRKTYLVTRHPPQTIKNRPPIQAKNAAHLCRTAAIKNKKTGRPIWTSCEFGCGNNLTSRGVIPKYFRRWRA